MGKAPTAVAADPNAKRRADLKACYQNLNDALLNMAKAMNEVSDVKSLSAIHYAYSMANAYANFVQQAILATNDAIFGGEIAHLKAQAKTLDDAKAKIEGIAKTIQTIAGALGFLATAASFVVGL